MFTSVVTKLPESQSTKSKRLNEQRLLSRNQNANFHFYFPEHAEFHVIKLNDPCWPEMELDEKLKFVDPDNFGKLIPLTFKGKDATARYIAVTGDPDKSVNVQSQMEHRINQAPTDKRSEISFSEVYSQANQERNTKTIPLSTYFKANVGQKGPTKDFAHGLKKCPRKKARIDDGRAGKENEFYDPEIEVVHSQVVPSSTSEPLVKGPTTSSQPIVACATSSQIAPSTTEQVDVHDESNSDESVLLSGDDEDVHELSPGNTELVSLLTNIHSVLKDCVEVMNIQRRESRAIRKYLEQPQMASNAHVVDSTPVSCEKVVLNGKVLNDLPGRTPGKYGLNLFKEFFQLSERVKGIAQPVASNKTELDPIRMEKIQKLVEARFHGQWMEARKSINECVRDSKKKLIRMQSGEADSNNGAISSAAVTDSST